MAKSRLETWNRRNERRKKRALWRISRVDAFRPKGRNPL